MTLVFVAAFLFAGAATTSAATLELAQAAFARAEYTSAESLALSAADEAKGAALYLVGLARFRAGHPEEALTALDEAGRTADPPAEGQWRFNRASCLYELGRFAEAEREYLRAAEVDRTLQVVATVNAGFAALDAGETARARELAVRARAVAAGDALELVVDLERQLGGPGAGVSESSLAEYRQGLADYDAGRFQEARQHFRTAAAAEPRDARSRIMWGAAALKVGERAEAREQLEAAIQLSADPTEAETARDYLAALSHGLMAHGRGPELGLRVGGGFDTNYLQSGPIDFTSTTSSVPLTGMATVSLAAGWKFRPLTFLYAEVSYAADQLAYLSSSAADYSVQQHLVSGVLEFSPQPWWRVGLSGTGLVDFVGLGKFRLLQVGGGPGAWLAVDEAEPTTTRVSVDWQWKGAAGDEFSYLTGARTDVSVSQTLRLGPTATELEYRFRHEGIGTLTQSTSMALPPRMCELDCTMNYVIPFGYLSHTAGLSFRVTLASILRLSASAGIEKRTYAADSFLRITAGDGSSSELDHRRRLDLRLFAGASASVRVWRSLDVSLRYDAVVNTSNINDSILDGRGGTCGPPDFVCHQFDYDNKNYTKHALLLETGYEW